MVVASTKLKPAKTVSRKPAAGKVENRHCRITYYDKGMTSEQIMPLSKLWTELSGLKAKASKWQPGYKVTFEILSSKP